MAWALVDMDGTLFDHDGALRRDMLAIASPQEKEFLKTVTNFHDLEGQEHYSNRIELIRKQPGWWVNLEKLEIGFTILEMIQDIGFCTKILTKGPKPWKNPGAWSEKAMCIHKHFGDTMNIDIVGRDKGGTYGRVLVDDYPKYLTDWLKHRQRGLAIMPAHPYNEGFTHPNVIRYDGMNYDEVRKALQAAYDRASAQHWKDLL